MSNNMCISRTHMFPPNGWQCVCPVTGVPISAPSYSLLLAASEAAMAERGITPPNDIAMQIQNAICQSASWKYCKPCRKGDVAIGFGQVVRWARAMWRLWKNHNFELVDPAEAERRASICAGCEFNVSTPAGCFGCKGIGTMVNSIRGKRSTSRDIQLGSCAKCGCFLQLLVWMPIDVVAEDAANLPDHCWKAK